MLDQHRFCRSTCKINLQGDGHDASMVIIPPAGGWNPELSFTAPSAVSQQYQTKALLTVKKDKDGVRYSKILSEIGQK